MVVAGGGMVVGGGWWWLLMVYLVVQGLCFSKYIACVPVVYRNIFQKII